MKTLKNIFMVVLAVVFLGLCAGASAEPKTTFDFEENAEGWEIPFWAEQQGDHVGRSMQVSPEKASKGKQSLEIMCDFPGDHWTAAVIEYAADVDLTGYKTLSFDVYLPRKASGGLYQGRIIFTVGPWYIFEMREPVPLTSGKWNTVTAYLEATDVGKLTYWKGLTRGVSLKDYLDQIKKIAIRVEYNANQWQAGPSYEGPIYIDHIVAER